jgi:hypothetical protein
MKFNDIIVKESLENKSTNKKLVDVAYCNDYIIFDNIFLKYIIKDIRNYYYFYKNKLFLNFLFKISEKENLKLKYNYYIYLYDNYYLLNNNYISILNDYN